VVAIPEQLVEVIGKRSKLPDGDIRKEFMIIIAEHLVLVFALLQWGMVWKSQKVHLLRYVTDNTNSFFWTEKGFAGCQVAQDLCRLIYSLELVCGFKISAVWIATEINKMADLSSRRFKKDGSVDVAALEEFETLNNALDYPYSQEVQCDAVTQMVGYFANISCPFQLTAMLELQTDMHLAEHVPVGSSVEMKKTEHICGDVGNEGIGGVFDFETGHKNSQRLISECESSILDESSITFGSSSAESSCEFYDSTSDFSFEERDFPVDQLSDDVNELLCAIGGTVSDFCEKSHVVIIGDSYVDEHGRSMRQILHEYREGWTIEEAKAWCRSNVPAHGVGLIGSAGCVASMGVTRAGGRPVFASETDPLRQALHEDFSGGSCLGDIFDLDWSRIPKATVWLITLPCVNFARSGNRKGRHGKTGGMYIQIANVLLFCLPLCFVHEMSDFAEQVNGGEETTMFLGKS